MINKPVANITFDELDFGISLISIFLFLRRSDEADIFGVHALGIWYHTVKNY
jgi:hypothetical protein